MSNWRNCNCERCRIHGLMLPVILVTVGALFLIGQYSMYSFDQLWPLILIAFGAMKVAESLASREGHVGR